MVDDEIFVYNENENMEKIIKIINKKNVNINMEKIEEKKNFIN